MTAAAAGGSAEAPPPARPEVLLKRGAGDIGDRHTATLGLVAKASVEIIRELHGGAAHGDASIPLAQLKGPGAASVDCGTARCSAWVGWRS